MDVIKRAPWVILIVAAIGGLVFYASRMSDQPASVGATEAQPANGPADAVAASDGLDAARVGKSADPSNQRTSAELYAEYRCQKAPCVDSPFIATSEQEAHWLSDNGFPSPRQFEEAESLSTGALRAKALQGASSDRALYAERLGQEGRWGESLGVLNGALKKGSIYALYSVSNVYAESPEYKDPILSRAYLRAANLSGDSKVVYVLGSRFPEFNSLPEQIKVDREAANIHRNMMRHKLAPRP